MQLVRRFAVRFRSGNLPNLIISTPTTYASVMLNSFLMRFGLKKISEVGVAIAVFATQRVAEYDLNRHIEFDYFPVPVLRQ